MVYSGPFLDCPKSALECCDCSDKSWAMRGGSSSFFRSRPAVEVEDGDVGSTGEGGKRLMVGEGPGKAVMDFCGEGRRERLCSFSC